MNEYKFEKRLEPGYTGYHAICFYYFEKDGEKMEATASKHLFEEDYKKEIPEETKKELIALIEKRLN